MSALFRTIQKADFTYPSWFSPTARALLDKILVSDPTTRISLKDVMLEPWMKVEEAKNADGDGETQEVKITAEQMESAIEEGVNESNTEKAVEGPKEMNAFDFINNCGGMALSRMFQKDKKVKRFTQYTSDLPPKIILDKISSVLEGLQCDVKIKENSWKINSSIITGKGMITLIVQIYMMADELHLVELRRGQGDNLEYHKLFDDVVSKLGDVLTVSE
jgi:serine/threonine protein kinase